MAYVWCLYSFVSPAEANLLHTDKIGEISMTKLLQFEMMFPRVSFIFLLGMMNPMSCSMYIWLYNYIYICIYISIRFTTDIIYYSHVLPQWQLFQCDFVLRGILAGDFIDFASGFIRWTALSGSGTVKAAAWEGLRFWGFPDRHGSREHPKKNIQCWPCSKERTIVFG